MKVTYDPQVDVLRIIFRRTLPWLRSREITQAQLPL